MPPPAASASWHLAYNAAEASVANVGSAMSVWPTPPSTVVSRSRYVEGGVQVGTEGPAGLPAEVIGCRLRDDPYESGRRTDGHAREAAAGVRVAHEVGAVG